MSMHINKTQVSLPKPYKARVTEYRMLNNRNLLLELSYLDPQEMNFVAGQFIVIRIKENTYRSYSICSDPLIKSSLKIVASVEHEGVGSNYLKNLKLGDIVEFLGPSGKFRFNSNLQNVLEINFVATGTGIAPFISMLYEISETKTDTKINLYFGARHEDEIIFEDKLAQFEEKLANFNFIPTISRPSNDWNRKTGYVTQFLSDANTKADFYLCGHPQMIEDAVEILSGKGVAKEKIHFEKFTVASPKK